MFEDDIEKLIDMLDLSMFETRTEHRLEDIIEILRKFVFAFRLTDKIKVACEFAEIGNARSFFPYWFGEDGWDKIRNYVESLKHTRKEYIDKVYENLKRCEIDYGVEFRGKEGTDIELMVQDWLKRRGIKFLGQHKIYFVDKKGEDYYTRVDFFIEPNICIYCDGIYWHGPCFPETQEKDKRQVKSLTERGYKVLRLSGRKIRSGEFVEELEAFLGL